MTVPFVIAYAVACGALGATGAFVAAVESVAGGAQGVSRLVVAGIVISLCVGAAILALGVACASVAQRRDERRRCARTLGMAAQAVQTGLLGAEITARA